MFAFILWSSFNFCFYNEERCLCLYREEGLAKVKSCNFNPACSRSNMSTKRTLKQLKNCNTDKPRSQVPEKIKVQGLDSYSWNLQYV